MTGLTSDHWFYLQFQKGGEMTGFTCEHVPLFQGFVLSLHCDYTVERYQGSHVSTCPCARGLRAGLVLLFAVAERWNNGRVHM
jgi:hypothetical protein